MQTDRGSYALKLGHLKHMGYKTGENVEEREHILALNCLSPDKAYITSALSPVARTSHMAESKLQEILW